MGIFATIKHRLIFGFLQDHSSQKTHQEKNTYAACYQEQIWKLKTNALFWLLELCEFLNVLATGSTQFN